VRPDKRIVFRIGIHQGDIVVEDGDIFGDGVNVAARLEGLAEPGGICVSARVQEDAAGKLDLAFEDMGEQSLKNIVRPVRVYRIRVGGPPEPARPALALPDKPSIAVLPFANLSGGSGAGIFRRRHGRGNHHGAFPDPLAVRNRPQFDLHIQRPPRGHERGRRELGVRYALEGSVRKASGRVRITAQLIDAITGAHLWADHFDGDLADVFDLQSQVAASVAGVIEPALQAAEMRRSAARPTTDLSAYDLYLRALAALFPVTKEG